MKQNICQHSKKRKAWFFNGKKNRRGNYPNKNGIKVMKSKVWIYECGSSSQNLFSRIYFLGDKTVLEEEAWDYISRRQNKDNKGDIYVIYNPRAAQ